jgi:hypothetical protein
MAKTFTYTNIAGLNRTLNALPKVAQAEMRNASLEIAEDVAREAASRASAQGGVAALVAPTIKAKRDRVPKVEMGGSKRLPADGRRRSGPRQTIGDVIWGAEFGSDRFRQFRPWRGNGSLAGYFLWPAIRDDAADILDRYGEALMNAVDSTARRNDG